MPKNTKAEAELTRARIVGAALEAFARHGAHGAGLEDVARQAGVSRGAIYWHFTDKGALLEELLGRLRWPLDVGANFGADAFHGPTLPLGLLHGCLVRQIGECRADPVQWPLVQWVVREPCEPANMDGWGLRIAAAQARAVRHLEAALSVAALRGQLREGLEPAMAARCLHAVGRGVLSERTEHSDPGQYLQQVGACLGFCLDGMTPGRWRTPPQRLSSAGHMP
ncbi:TetR family transcriptional regulator [Paracidovorax valerianellae]|uniref:Transcriptional regulator, TetR family n=1 Tax=Paracidovorax valerianellae TaxID=187868 RepID=A0A1G6XV52_9BURK|nr:TetR family transcriptional regulator [Paracidovorax valerianellae]MDA8443567.1 TetR/AcrR family transcriptional regulator [Paracidovorax valerianellae]SDD81892.1 transcriptional regulator, TetR family [Paracidovorax valerianellae]